VLLHLVFGALALVTAQALIRPLGRAMDGSMLGGVMGVAHAEQHVASSSAVSQPALSTSAASSSQPTGLQPGRSTVMSDLSATFQRPAAPAGIGTTAWEGVAGQDMNLRAQPNRAQPPVGQLKAGTPVSVKRWVSGDEVEPHNDTWAELADGTYVFSTALRRSGGVTPPTLPADAPTTGRWVDVNLTEQIATAYDGQTVLRSVLISSGRPGWETPTGTFPVLRRVEKDTMDGSTLIGQGPNGAGASYKVENVRYVQYFTTDGAAIHENYWRRPATFGVPGSHGCIGMLPADAAWFWEFATVGTPLVIHE
jgi:lipoprotein-anchoring transpeptidase ErfK/SrfK